MQWNIFLKRSQTAMKILRAEGMLYNARGTTAFPVRPAASAAIRWGNPAIIQYFLPVILHFSHIPVKIHLFTHFLSIQVKMTSNSCIFAGFPVSPADPGKKLHACRNFVFLGLLHRFSNSYFPLVPPFFSFLFRVHASTPSPPLLFHSCLPGPPRSRQHVWAHEPPLLHYCFPHPSFRQHAPAPPPFHSVSRAPHSMTPASLSPSHPPLPILQKNNRLHIS